MDRMKKKTDGHYKYNRTTTESNRKKSIDNQNQWQLFFFRDCEWKRKTPKEKNNWSAINNDDVVVVVVDHVDDDDYCFDFSVIVIIIIISEWNKQTNKQKYWITGWTHIVNVKVKWDNIYFGSDSLLLSLLFFIIFN